MLGESKPPKPSAEGSREMDSEANASPMAWMRAMFSLGPRLGALQSLTETEEHDRDRVQQRHGPEKK